MKNKLLLFLSLILPGFHQSLLAGGCSDPFLVIGNKARVSWPQYNGQPTLFFNLNDSSEITAKQTGNRMCAPSITRILLNGSEIQPLRINSRSVKLRNNPGKYEFEVFFLINSAVPFTATITLYISDQMAVGIDEEREAGSGFVLAPNLANNSFGIESTAPLKSVSIFDLTGKQLQFIEAQGNSLNIPLDTYPRGIYLVKVALEPEKIVVKKLVVQ